MTTVVDASFAGAWILPDERSKEADRVLQQALQGETEIAAPDLWSYELLNLLLNASRRGRIQTGFIEKALQLVERIPITFHDHQSELVRRSTIRLAVRFSLSAYDASYLELANRLQCPLRSADQRLLEAARVLRLNPDS